MINSDIFMFVIGIKKAVVLRKKRSKALAHLCDAQFVVLCTVAIHVRYPFLFCGSCWNVL